jgi:hypothetical protein
MRGVQVALVAVALATTSFIPANSVYADKPLSLEEAVTVLCQPQYKWDCNWIVNKAYQESNFDPGAVNLDCDFSGTYKYQCYGFLQVEAGNAPNGDVEALKDLYINIYISYRLYLEKGKDPWGG